MAQRSIALLFDTDVVTARALARAALHILEAVGADDSSVTVDGFAMKASDKWTGDQKYRIVVEPR